MTARRNSAEITEKMDDALWNSIRAFEEGELFMRHVAQHLDHGLKKVIQT